jgi:hypothetical protein
MGVEPWYTDQGVAGLAQVRCILFSCLVLAPREAPPPRTAGGARARPMAGEAGRAGGARARRGRPRGGARPAARPRAGEGWAGGGGRPRGQGRGEAGPPRARRGRPQQRGGWRGAANGVAERLNRAAARSLAVQRVWKRRERRLPIGNAPTYPVYMPRTCVQVNFLGPYTLTRLLQDTLVASGSPRIVNVASVMHRCGRHPSGRGGCRGMPRRMVGWRGIKRS